MENAFIRYVFLTYPFNSVLFLSNNRRITSQSLPSFIYFNFYGDCLVKHQAGFSQIIIYEKYHGQIKEKLKIITKFFQN